MTAKIIQKGAEANIILIKQKGKESFIIKDRTKKSYRIPFLDEKIRDKRTRSEAKLLSKASEVIDCPKPFFEPSIKNVYRINMPFIEGKKLSESLNLFPLVKQKKMCKQMGENIAKLHDVDIIHGDLTTSNMILHGSQIFFLDFGLGFISNRIEDKAVDLHLLKQALEAKHFQHWSILFSQVLLGYSKSKDSKKVLEQFKKVETRGRYKEKY